VWIWREHFEAIRQRDQATASAKLASSHLDQAVSTIDQLLERVENEPLLKKEEMQPLRDALLQDALHFNEQLIDNSGDQPEARLAVGAAYERIGKIQELRHKVEESCGAFGLASAVYTELTAQRPPKGRAIGLGEGQDHLQFRSCVARAYRRIAGIQQSRRKFEEAFAAYRMATSISEGLRAESPSKPLYFGAEWIGSTSSHIFALLERNTNDDQREALRLLETMRRQLEVFIELTGSPYQRTWVTIALARSMFCMAHIHAQLGNREQAEKSCRTGIALLENISEEDWTEMAETESRGSYWMVLRESRSSVVEGFYKGADRPAKAGRPPLADRLAAAEKWYRETIDGERKVAANSPNDFFWGNVKFSFGLTFRQKHRFKEAAQAFRAAVRHFGELSSSASYIQYLKARAQYYLGIVLPAAGGSEEEAGQLFQDAVRILEVLTRKFPGEGRYDLYQAYGALGNCLPIRDPQASAEAFQNAIHVMGQFCDDQPDEPKYQGQLTVAIGRYGRFKFDQGDRATARVLMQRRVDIANWGPHEVSGECRNGLTSFRFPSKGSKRPGADRNCDAPRLAVSRTPFLRNAINQRRIWHILQRSSAR
jgi:tetratricopeptide (TPR) repeat protein